MLIICFTFVLPFYLKTFFHCWVRKSTVLLIIWNQNDLYPLFVLHHSAELWNQARSWRSCTGRMTSHMNLLLAVNTTSVLESLQKSNFTGKQKTLFYLFYWSINHEVLTQNELYLTFLNYAKKWKIKGIGLVPTVVTNNRSSNEEASNSDHLSDLFMCEESHRDSGF